MSRHLAAVPPPKELDAVVTRYVRAQIAEKFADDVIEGRVVHNLETDTFQLREKCSPEFLAESKAAYARFIDRLDS